MEDEKATISKAMRYTKLEMETNYLLAVKIIQQDNVEFHPLRAIIKGCRYLLEVYKVNIINIWREANQWADFMANEGHMHETDLLLWENVIKEMKFLLLAYLSSFHSCQVEALDHKS